MTGQPPIAASLGRSARAHLAGHLLPFWSGPALDPANGGWRSWLTNDLRPDTSQPQGLIVNCRILWAFSAVSRVLPDPLWKAMADRAWQIVMNRFWDPQNGGAFWRLSNDWALVDPAKKVYGQAFYIYALSEHWLAFRNERSLDRARELFGLLEAHARDTRDGGYWEVLNRDWSPAADSRLSEKDLNEKKSMNNHLHVLEAYANLYRAWPEPLVAQRLRELVLIFLERILDAHTHHLNHFFDEQWHVRSDTYTFGHDIEAAWLLCEAAEVLGDHALMERVNRVALKMAEAVLPAVDTDGGLFYEGKEGRVIVHGKECWPQAEAVVGFLNAWQISGEERFLETAARVWNFIETRLADREHGEWFWKITPNGPDPSLPKVSEWKGPYHGTRACLETMRRTGEKKK